MWINLFYWYTKQFAFYTKADYVLLEIFDSVQISVNVRAESQIGILSSLSIPHQPLASPTKAPIDIFTEELMESLGLSRSAPRFLPRQLSCKNIMLLKYSVLMLKYLEYSPQIFKYLECSLQILKYFKYSLQIIFPHSLPQLKVVCNDVHFLAFPAKFQINFFCISRNQL